MDFHKITIKMRGWDDNACLGARNTSSIGAWPNSLDRRLPWYCIVYLLLQTNKKTAEVSKTGITFVSPIWKLHNPYCHITQLLLRMRKMWQIAPWSGIFKVANCHRPSQLANGKGPKVSLVHPRPMMVPKLKSQWCDLSCMHNFYSFWLAF